jgi:hypothetical protein
MRYGIQKKTPCIGWHLPKDLIQEILNVLRNQGATAWGVRYAILEREVPKEVRGLTAEQLMTHVRFPEHFN